MEAADSYAAMSSCLSTAMTQLVGVSLLERCSNSALRCHFVCKICVDSGVA